MTHQEQIEPQLQEENIAPTTQESAQDQGNEIVYIAELNGEFFTVDYNNENEEPMVTPLKIVEFMQPVASSANSKQLASADNNSNGDLSTEVKSSEKLSTVQPTKGKLSENKILALGIGLGLLIAWGVTKFLTASSISEPVVNTPAELALSQIRSVTVAPVKTSTVDRTIEVSGTVEALELIPITPEATGLQVAEILVDEGTKVTEGQVLAKLKDDTLKAESIQAQAAVEGAKARLAELQAGTRSEEVARAQQRVNSATAGVEQAKSNLELVSKRVKRNQDLHAEGAISSDRLDEINNQERISRANLSQAEASLQEANQQLQELKTGARPEVISQAEAELAQAEGKLAYASVQLENTVVKAVADGIVAERNAKVGDLTSPSQTMFTIIENGSLELRLQVPETDLNKIKAGQTVRIANNQTNSAPIIGKVREIDPIVNSDSRQAIVKVNLPADTNLQPGMFLEAAITTSQSQGTTVPIKALLPQIGDNAIAFVVEENNTVSARSVKMGDILADNQIEVLSGLEAGDNVVLKGAAYLKDGDRISLENNSAK